MKAHKIITYPHIFLLFFLIFALVLAGLVCPMIASVLLLGSTKHHKNVGKTVYNMVKRYKTWVIYSFSHLKH